MKAQEEAQEQETNRREALREAEEVRAARERELWLRSRLDREREENLLILRYLAFQRESPLMRFWRWLIDDTRSQRREEQAIFADYPGAPIVYDGWAVRIAEYFRRRWRKEKQG